MMTSIANTLFRLLINLKNWSDGFSKVYSTSASFNWFALNASRKCIRGAQVYSWNRNNLTSKIHKSYLTQWRYPAIYGMQRKECLAVSKRGVNRKNSSCAVFWIASLWNWLCFSRNRCVHNIVRISIHSGEVSIDVPSPSRQKWRN